MRLNIVDPNNLELLGVLTQYESVQWTSTFNTPDGSFQINCSTDYIDLLQLDRYIENTEELDHIGVIKQVQVVSSNQKTSLQVKGVMLEKDIFSKRVIKAFIMYQDIYLTMALNGIISQSITEPAEPDRKMSTIGEVIIPKDSDIPDIEKTEYSTNYSNLEEEVFNLLQTLDIGVKARINRTTNKIDVEFYTGYDYTFGTDNPVVFSPERGTVLETEYTKDSSQNITDILLIGEDNVILQAERERKEGEPLVEKSIDVSSECPWPTYAVEKPNEDGGQYFRYKKYNPPADFIANRDVWEKYAVDRIETTETRYKEVEQTVEVPVDLGDWFKNAEVSPTKRNKDSIGAILSSPLPVSAALEGARRNNPPGVKTSLGILAAGWFAETSSVSMFSANSPTENAIFIDDPNAVKPPHLNKENYYRAAKKTNKLGSVKKKANKVNKVSSTNKGVEVLNPGKSQSGGRKTVGEEYWGELLDPIGQNLTITKTEIVMEPYEVTVVTYETKDFIDYVYVNIGDAPSISSKIVQGSVASGDVFYYENFEDVRVDINKYRDTLMKKAKGYLRTFVLSEDVNIKPYYLANIEFGDEYTLGDIVTARNTKLGYTVDLRVTQATKTWDSKGFRLDIGLGDSVPSLTNRIKLIAKGGV